ncbi:MAG TPA: 16S rRNA (uracil(1498)-N(3))-methyltransferase [Bacteroidia bacterium]|jgi:16S rRNA (uracil1498-N3)-methyltransferase|nr:16S rRNA (uracil(1498)-N(3))-methyltransferase [Bacteroidia bacterium]
MHRFYIPKITDDTCKLDEEESKHCVRVLRLRENDAVEIIDGKGNLYKTLIENANPKACVLKVESQSFEPKQSWELVIAVAPTKNMVRMEWLIEKLTEIGFTKFIPVECNNSERRVIKTERLNKIAIEAMKQSGRVYLPQMEELISFEKLVRNYQAFTGQKFIPHCNNSEKKSLNSAYKTGENAFVLIGPEGDFTKEEIELAIGSGFIPVSLNEKTLRTETAALSAAIALNTLNNR